MLTRLTSKFSSRWKNTLTAQRSCCGSREHLQVSTNIVKSLHNIINDARHEKNTSHVNSHISAEQRWNHVEASIWEIESGGSSPCLEVKLGIASNYTIKENQDPKNRCPTISSQSVSALHSTSASVIQETCFQHTHLVTSAI